MRSRGKAVEAVWGKCGHSQHLMNETSPSKPGGWAAVLRRLHTADHRRLPSPMREPQFPDTPLHGTGILRLPVSEQEDPVAVRCADHRQRMFSVLL